MTKSLLKSTDLFSAAAGTAALTALGGWLGPMVGLPAGGTALLCGMPIATAAVVADRRRGVAAAVGLGVTGAAALWHDLVTPVALGASLVTAASVVASVALAATRRHAHESRARGLERLNGQILADAVRRPETHVEPIAPEEEVVAYATSLLTLQEAGRRIATHLDLDTLVPTVVTTARAALKSRDVVVYFWDARSGTLNDALPPRPRDIGRYVPDPTRGAAKWVIENRQVLTAAAVQADPILAAATMGDARRPAGIAPLLAGNELLGLLVVDGSDRPGPMFGRMLYILANLAALGIKNAQLFRRIEESARRDALTGLLNRGGFEVAADEMLDAARSGESLTLLMSDLDHFKRLNDDHGHLAGDAVLQEAARLWQASLPDDALVARYGGEEFLAALPDCDVERGRDLAESLRESLEGHPFLHDGETLSVTASFGVAQFDRPERDLSGLLRQADGALYRAKADGRNRVCVAHEVAAATAAD